MITEDYVSFETAKLLKEKGFDTPCDRWYSEYTPQYYGHEKHICIEFDEHHRYENNYEFICYAPTLQMAMKWLREVHNITIGITFSSGIISYEIQKNGEFITSIGSSRTYEQMVEEAIQLCVKTLI